MSLPPGFLDELRDRVSLADIAGRKVTWDQRRSNQGRGDFWAPCPFHSEKTASFHVDERKGFYYCFGCQAKGDAIAFLRETENLGFMEAVARLAEEVGLAMPSADPQAAERQSRRQGLADLTEAAIRYFRRALAASGGAAAREYLAARGLSAETQDRFEIGFAPDDRQGLTRHLQQQGAPLERIVEAGLAARPEGGGAPYDRFRGRLMFPIRDGQGRCTGFGGRALSAEAKAKYFNSPEGPLFDKSRSLYNHAPAREAARRGETLIVAEGYLDVIALASAGFAGAVAPLGTAVTEAQLELLWRMSPEPVVALDGDAAGLRAAYRLIDLALPKIAAGRGLRFCMLPAETDPDDLIRTQGPAAMQALLEKAEPMVALVWRRETEGRDFDSPERRAGLQNRLATVAAAIADPSLARFYRDALREKQWQLFRGATPGAGRDARASRRGGPRPGGPGTPGRALVSAPVSGTKRSRLAAATGDVGDTLREAAVLAVLVANPKHLSRFEDDLAALATTEAMHDRLRAALLDCAGLPPEAVPDALAEKLGRPALDSFMAQTHVAVIPAVRRPGHPDAALGLAEDFARLFAHRGLLREIDEAGDSLGSAPDERVTWRLAEASAARQRADRSLTDDRAEFDLGPNGAKLDRGERKSFEALLRGILGSDKDPT